MVVSLAADSTDPVAALEAMRVDRGLPLSFWAEDVPAQLEKFVQDHPCGEILTARVAEIPDPSRTPYLVPETVLELDDAGRMRTSWRIPIDSVVHSIRGNTILVTRTYTTKKGAEIAVGLAVEPNGEFTVVAPADTLIEQIQCPELPSFGRSSYLNCWRLRDPDSGAIRRVAYQIPCS